MKSDKVDVIYGGYSLVAAFYKGKYQGRALFNKKRVFDVEGTDIDDVLNKLKEAINQEHRRRMVPGAATPKVEAFLDAFQRVMKSINDGQYAMLKAHFRAPGHRLSPTELAKAAGYSGVGGVNLWYGFLGQWLFEGMTENVDVMLNLDDSPVFTSVLAKYVPDPASPETNYVWEMRPEVIEAIEVLGLAD
jgi:hypothetical protein